MAQAKTPEERKRIEALPLDVASSQVTDVQFSTVGKNLEEAPPVRFDLARQVRVFEPYLQYVKLNLTGAAIQRHRLSIPPSIQKLGGSKDLERRLHTTFDLIEKSSKLSSKPLEHELNDIRKNFTRSLGNDHGRVVLKAAKPHLVARLAAFRAKLVSHQAAVAGDLQQHLDASRKQIVDYYLPRIVEAPPDALVGQSLRGKPSAGEARCWLNAVLDRVFPSAESLIQEMKLQERFKDVTFETLNREDFLESIKAVITTVDWDKAYAEFRAAGEMLKEPRRRVRFLRREEAQRLLDAMPKHLKPIVRFALATGCRAGEIFGLAWHRVDLTRKVAWLDHGATKSGEGRGIPLNADAVAALRLTFGQHPRWCFTFAGKRILKSSTAWDRARQRAGIEDFRFHDLRHTWASWHVQSGTSLPELMELGGWKSYEMVLRYAHLAPEKLSSVASRIEWHSSKQDGTSGNEAVAPSATFPLRSTN